MSNKKDKIPELNLLESHIKVFNFIQQYIADRTISPEVSEIEKGTSLSSRHIYRVIEDFIAHGYLSKRKNFRRSIKILKDLK